MEKTAEGLRRLTSARTTQSSTLSEPRSAGNASHQHRDSSPGVCVTGKSEQQGETQKRNEEKTEREETGTEQEMRWKRHAKTWEMET